MTILVRPRAWWYNKVPLSVLLGLMLVGGRPFTVSVFLVLAGLVATVCCVANYGYALNELFDREEDRRAGRRNVAADRSNSAVTTIILLSAGSALLVANFTGGIRGLLATAVVLFLPLAYSVPPLRTKERGWLASCATLPPRTFIQPCLR